jgi:hypothetical protein
VIFLPVQATASPLASEEDKDLLKDCVAGHKKAFLYVSTFRALCRTVDRPLV